ncbi:MAG: thioredoxin family protein, partial [Bacteroidales bacterium]|nr:thioredoxin family protein [Bacteroidales bacterium]
GIPGGSLSEMTLCESSKYGDMLSLPYDLKGYFDYEQGMACAKSLNKPVLLDFKGHACSNCKIMEAEVWSHPEILDLLRKQFVIIALYTDDRTLLPENQWIVSKLDGRVKKTMGQVNADFEMSQFKSNTMPLYVILDSGGKMLTEPVGYQPDPEKFLDFLKKGLKSE